MEQLELTGNDIFAVDIDFHKRKYLNCYKSYNLGISDYLNL